jgi:dipeptidyl aminopeptidase/acylaminoacyl peptidase
MKYLVVSFFFLMLFSVSCDKQESSDSTDETRLWPPALVGTRGDSSVELEWQSYILMEKIFRPYTYIDPEKFEIYMSVVSPEKLVKIATLENDKQYRFTTSNLKNGLSYFFAVRAIRQGEVPLMSDTIMVIPSGPENIQQLADNKDFPMESGSISKGSRKIAYVNRNFTWDNGKYGQVSLFSLDMVTGENKIIDTASYFPDWSPTEMKVVYCSDKHEINSGNKRPQHIIIYDTQTGTIKKLTSGTSFDISPDFSPDGKWIIYSSDEGKSGIFDFWKISTDGSQKVRITDNLNLTDAYTGNLSLGRPVWSADGKYIYYNVITGNINKDGIYRLNLQNGVSESIIKSGWSEMCPSVSPDDKNIAFISNRSGTRQIWSYNLTSGTYKQVSGCRGDNINTDWGKLEWIDNNNILYSGYSSTNSKETLFTIEVR